VKLQTHLLTCDDFHFSVTFHCLSDAFLMSLFLKFLAFLISEITNHLSAKSQTYDLSCRFNFRSGSAAQQSSLVASSRENIFQALHDHLQVSPSNHTTVSPGAVRSIYSEYQSPPPAFCRSRGLTGACLSYVQLHSKQLCCLRSKTVKQSAIVTSWSNTHTFAFL